MDKYKRLISNTLLFAISSFSSKILSFLLMPFFTRMFGLGEFGDADLITKYAQLLLPVVSVGVANAIIRYGLDKAYDKASVFTGGLLAELVGIGIFFLCWPLVSKIPGMQNYTALLYAYVIMSILRNLCSQFVRAKQYIRLYAVDGVLNTCLYLFFIILFIAGFHWGIYGYVLATAAADFCSAVFLFTVARLHRYIRLSRFNGPLLRQMLRYAVPLIPTSMFWWITNTSDHMFITAMIGSEANGLYVAAYKVPNVIMLFSTLFTEAWQLSAVTDGGRGTPGRAKFFTRVFQNYQSLMFIVAAGLILFCKPVMMVLTLSGDSAFNEAWQYIPLLVVATVFSCFVTFLGSIYMVEMRSGQSFVTMMIGAGSNLLMNWLLIPDFGPNGAAFATFASYLLVFVIRALGTRRYIRINLHPLRMLWTMVLISGEIALMLAQVPLWQLWCSLLCAAVIFFNFGPLLETATQLLGRLRRRRA